MISLARSEDGMSVDYAELDKQPELLNVANGTLDLAKGILRPHNAADLLTKLSPVRYDPAATCERFERFLSEIMAGDAESVQFLRRFLGYCITGSIREHTMCFWHGETGGNGKSTLAAIMFFVLGDYGIKAAPDLLFRSEKSQRHPTELADLHGARFVVCNETSAKRTWDEATVKDITGGDLLKARRMREDFWSFTPTHKVVVFGNAKPTIENTADGGLKRRLRLVPFEVTFSGAPDKRLDVTLRKEASGVLRYLVDGCLAWQRDGLTEPKAITDATAEYFAEQDIIGRFVAERCELNVLARVPCAELRTAVEAWAVDKGESKPSPKDVARWLAKNVQLNPGEKLATSARDPGGRVVNAWRGIRLRPTAASNHDPRTGEKPGESEAS
jgi:putative DNA primase/helicase